MTEMEWLAASDPYPAVMLLRGKTSDRKLRLFAVACCTRMVAKVHVNEYARRALQLGELFADGHATAEEMRDLRVPVSLPTGLEPEVHRRGSSMGHYACSDCMKQDDAVEMADGASCNSSWAMTTYESSPPDHNGLSPIFNARLAAEQAIQSDLLRCIFGNPFRPVEFDPRWRSETAVALAAGIYAERAFDRLPILADALEEAGCDAVEVLSHLRGPGPHARGCWVVDEVLGKG